MDTAKQSHYPGGIEWGLYEKELHKVAENSLYMKFKPKIGYISFYARYEFRFLDYLIYRDNYFIYDEKISWNAYYSFQHDETEHMSINCWFIIR